MTPGEVIWALLYGLAMMVGGGAIVYLRGAAGRAEDDERYDSIAKSVTDLNASLSGAAGRLFEAAQTNGEPEGDVGPHMHFEIRGEGGTFDGDAPPEPFIPEVPERTRLAYNDMIVNRNNRKLHVAECRYAPTVGDQMFITHAEDLEVLVKLDRLVPCGHCKPGRVLEAV